MSSLLNDSSTSLTLVARLGSFDEAAWADLSRLYGPQIYRWARNCGLQSHDAADVLQSVLLSVMRGIHKFSHDRPDASFRGWLWTITHNAARGLVRRRQARPAVPGGSEVKALIDSLADLDQPEETPPDATELTGLTHRAVEIVRGHVDPQTWQAFWDVAISDCSVSDTAARLGMTCMAVRQAKYRVLCRLRYLLADR